jgi:5-methyltetrahydropteroyltriglutamate--homocysteine methyltransferase
MQRTKPPYRADHVGSLIRPDALIRAREQAEQKAIPEAELKRIQHAAIRDVVRMQEELGLKLVTDGEYNRHSWHRDFMLKFENVRMMPSKLTVRFHSADGDRLHSPPTMQVTGKLARPNGGGIFVDDFKFLASIARATPKITLPSPTVMHFRGGRTRSMPRPIPTSPNSTTISAVSTARKSATLPRPAAATCRSTRSISPISAIRTCASRSPISAKIRRRCRRPMRSSSTIRSGTVRGHGGLHAPVPRQFRRCVGGGRQLRADCRAHLQRDQRRRLFLEYDSTRAGGFEPLRFLPKGKVAVLGLVTTKSGELESKDELKRRIDAAAKQAPLEQLALSPQCGFLQRHRRQHHGCRRRNRQAPPGGRDRARGVGRRVAAPAGLC